MPWWWRIFEIPWWIIILGMALIASLVSMREGNSFVGRAASGIATFLFFVLDPLEGLFNCRDRRAIERRREQARLAHPDLRRLIQIDRGP
jgi:hypothetical protein